MEAKHLTLSFILVYIVATYHEKLHLVIKCILLENLHILNTTGLKSTCQFLSKHRHEQGLWTEITDQKISQQFVGEKKTTAYYVTKIKFLYSSWQTTHFILILAIPSIFC